MGNWGERPVKIGEGEKMETSPRIYRSLCRWGPKTMQVPTSRKRKIRKKNIQLAESCLVVVGTWSTIPPRVSLTETPPISLDSSWIWGLKKERNSGVKRKHGPPFPHHPITAQESTFPRLLFCFLFCFVFFLNNNSDNITISIWWFKFGSFLLVR